ncbi:MAG: Trehalose utilization [Planctomycetes bacterium ADurb.Bin126]|nr:MAG: Trehalose utilization [Planctomycetes bacterium ADurb.Bin126]HQL71694.1 ThuA domain-containing protein [Phycisphaerae bacterium]
MSFRCLWLPLFALLLLSCSVFAIEDIPAHQKKRIDQAVPAGPRGQVNKPRRVLIFSTPDHLYAKDPHKGYCVPYGAYAFKALGEKTKAYEPVLSADLAMFLPDNLAPFDAVVMNNSCGAWITPTDEDMAKAEFKKLGADKAAVEQALRQALLDYVRNGGGIVAIHFAIAANRHWPAFAELIGGQFTGHPWNEEIGVCAEEPSHPLLAAFGGKDFRLADEIYQYGKPYNRSAVRVLLSLDPERTNMGVRWINQPDNDFALAWVKSQGKGRVFYTSFGHRTELFWHPQLLQMYLDAVQFAAGDLDAPTAPRADRPNKRMPGPTPAEQRLALMKARKVPVPSDEEVAKIEAAAPDKPPAKPARPRKILVWGHSWTHLPNPYAEKAIEILGRKTGAFTATVSDDPRLLIADRLAQFDALVMNNIHENEPFLPLDFGKLGPEQQEAARKMDQAIRKSILDFAAGTKEGNRTIPGKGIVGTHAATAALNKWPEYLEMMGGSFGGYILQDLVVKVEQPTHPLTACFGDKTFAINDEIYIFPQADQRQKLRILLSLDMDKTKFPEKVQLARPGLEKGRPDKDHAISWIRPFGTGRVFYTVLGHQPETHWNPQFLAHLLAGIQYAIGDLPADGK